MVGEPVGAVAIFAQAQHAKYPFWRMWRSSTGAKSGSRRAAITAKLWPPAQRSRPASHCWGPRPTAAASVPLTIARPRGAPPSSSGLPSEPGNGTSKPSICWPLDRKRHVEGKDVSVSVDLGGRRTIKKTKEHKQNTKYEKD